MRVEDEHYHHVAVDLLDRGRLVTVREVEVYGEYYRGGTTVERVRVTFTLQGRTVTTDLVAGYDPDAEVEDGWQAPPAGSFYAPPLEVVVSPDDVDLAMAVDDVDLYRESTFGCDLSITGALLAVGAGASFMAWRQRPPAGRHRK